MNNSIKGRNTKEVRIQLKRAEIQKNILKKNIYKEYEIYFNIVRKSILPSAKNGIFELYSDLSVTNKSLNSKELNNFFNKNISMLINSKLPLLTIEQLRLGDIRDLKKQFVNVNALKKLVGFEEFQAVDFENNLVTKDESLEFYCNNNLNSYSYYESLSKDELTSVNLDESYNLNSFFKKDSFKKIKYKEISDSSFALREDTKDNNLDNHENLNEKVNDVFISGNNLTFFELIDKAFINFLLNLSYKINLELIKINLINKTISENTLKCLLNNNYNINHPFPFVINYDLNGDKYNPDNSKSCQIYLINISNIELEFNDLDLSICRNKINDLKNRYSLLHKKHLYWINKELMLNNLS